MPSDWGSTIMLIKAPDTDSCSGSELETGESRDPIGTEPQAGRLGRCRNDQLQLRDVIAAPAVAAVRSVRTVTAATALSTVIGMPT